MPGKQALIDHLLDTHVAGRTAERKREIGREEVQLEGLRE